MKGEVVVFRHADQAQESLTVAQVWRELESGKLTDADFALARDGSWKAIGEVLAAEYPLTADVAPAVREERVAARKEYHVDMVSTGFFSGTLCPRKLWEALNQSGKKGWRFVRSIQETRRLLFFFKRETHFLIFERDL